MMDNITKIQCQHARITGEICPWCNRPLTTVFTHEVTLVTGDAGATDSTYTIESTGYTTMAAYLEAKHADQYRHYQEAHPVPKKKRVELPDPHRTEVRREQRQRQMRDARRFGA